MTSPRRPRPIGRVIAAACGLAVFALAPVALAQTAPVTPTPIAPQWEGSRFTADDFAAGSAARGTKQFDLSGVFVRSSQLSNPAISPVSYEFADNSPEGFDLPAGANCVPAAIPQAEIADPPSQAPPPGTARAEFDTASTTADGGGEVDSVQWPCNGQFRIAVTAVAGIDSQVLSTIVKVAAPPAVVGGPTAVAEARTVTVGWTPLPDTALQLLGYQVERAGPADADGNFGAFAKVGDRIAVGGGSTATDTVTEDGDYKYRVRAVRDAVDAPVLSLPTATPSATVTVGAATPPSTAPPTSKPGSGPDPTLPDLGSGPATTNKGSTNVTPRRPGLTPLPSPTTIDTGFNDLLDYGDLGDDREPGEQEAALPGDGSAIINTEAPGAGLAVPFAGAMVLLGWAGHIAYLNRLARQF